MAYYIDRSPITPERLNTTLGKLATAARIDREAAAFARRLAASPLVGKVATSAISPQLKALAPDRMCYFSIRENTERTRYFVVIDESAGLRYRDEGRFDIILATYQDKRISAEKLLAQAKEHDKSAAEYMRRAEELPGLVAQLNNLLPYLDKLERAAETVKSYAPWG